MAQHGYPQCTRVMHLRQVQLRQGHPAAKQMRVPFAETGQGKQAFALGDCRNDLRNPPVLQVQVKQAVFSKQADRFQHHALILDLRHFAAEGQRIAQIGRIKIAGIAVARMGGPSDGRRRCGIADHLDRAYPHIGPIALPRHKV